MRDINEKRQRSYLNKSGYMSVGLLLLAVLVMVGYMFVLPALVPPPT